MPNPMTLNPDEILYEEDDQIEGLPSGQRKTYYLYELKKLIKGKSDSLLTFSPNSVNLVIIDKDEFLKFDAWRPDAQTFEYRTKQSVSNMDGEVDIVQYEKENVYSYIDLTGLLEFDNGKVFKYSRNKLYMVSEFILETDDDITNFGYLIQKIDVDSPLTDNMNGNKNIEIVDLNTWAARDSNNAIFRIGKQLDKIDVIGIKLTTPSSFLLNSIQALGENKYGSLTNPKIYSITNLIPFYVNPIEILDTGVVNLLNLWMSDTVLPLELAMDFIKENNIGKLLPSNDKTNSYDEVLDTDSIEKIEIVSDGTYVGGSVADTGYPLFQKYVAFSSIGFTKQNYTIPGKLPNLGGTGGAIGKPNSASSSITNISRMKIYYLEKLQKSPIYDLLVEVLEASYNYKNNFKGAGYEDEQTGKLNKMALYKQQFEGKTIVEYIDGIEKNWEQDNPKLVSDVQYINYKKVRSMLSHNIFGSLSINEGLNEDNKILLPWYFELLTKPIWDGIGKPDDGNGKWVYKDQIKVILKSLYFDLDKISSKNLGNGISLINLMSESTILKNNKDRFIWPLLPNKIDQTELPSLSVKDLKLSDENVGKYLTFVEQNWIDYFGKRDDLLKLTALDTIELSGNNQKILEFSLETNNIRQLDILGLYGAGEWSIEIKTSKESVLISKIPLFKFNNQQISRIKVII